MTRFEDGPAAGQTLMLKRVARFLRVTAVIAPESGKVSKWDALDQLGDSPRPDETLYAYEVFGEIGMAFVDGKNVHGCYPIANYRFVKEQPTQAIMMSTQGWHEWCLKQVGGRNEV